MIRPAASGEAQRAALERSPSVRNASMTVWMRVAAKANGLTRPRAR